MSADFPANRHPKRMALAAGIVFACALAAGTADATLYKWTDANGRVVYSDQAPTGGVKFEIVNAASPPDNPAAVREMASKELEMKKAQRERAEDAAKADKSRADAVKRADICAKARSGIRLYQNEYEGIYAYDAKGQRVMLDAAERQRRLAEQQQLAREYCTG
jgi:hypothetical protein